jgi:hypothetical protein
MVRFRFSRFKGRDAKLLQLNHELKLAHLDQMNSRTQYMVAIDRVNSAAGGLYRGVIESIYGIVRVAQFSTRLVVMGNYYLWSKGLGLALGLVGF